MPTRNDLEQLIGKIEQSFPTDVILLSPNSLGEICILAAFAESIKSAYGGGLVGIIPPERMAMLEYFPGAFDRVLGIDLTIQRQFTDFGLTQTDKLRLGRAFNTFFAQYGNGRLYDLVRLKAQTRNSGLTLTDMFRHMLNLPWNSGFGRGTISDSLLADALQFISANSISTPFCLLQTGNNTNAPFHPYFWEEVSSQLISQGITPVVNSHGARFRTDNFNVPGLLSVNVPLRLLPAVAQLSARVITGVNGATQLILMTTKGIRIDAIRNDSYNTGTSNFVPCMFLEQSIRLLGPECISSEADFYEWDLSVDSTKEQMSSVAKLMIASNA